MKRVRLLGLGFYMECLHNCQLDDHAIRPYTCFTYANSNYHCHNNS